MRNNYILGAVAAVTLVLLTVAFTHFASSANNTSASPVLQAVAAAPPVATAPAAPATRAAPAVAAAAKPAPATAAPVASAAPAIKQDAPRDFDDWRMLCATSAQGKKQCNLVQTLVWEKGKPENVALRAVVHPAQLKDKPATGMRLVTPLGTVLTPGMAIKIDDGKDIKIPYTQCLPGGCMVDVIFDQDMLGKLKAGKSLFVAYRLPNGKDSTLKVSLKGFATAVDAMSNGSKG